MLYYDKNTEIKKLQSLLSAKGKHDTYEILRCDELIVNDFSFDILLFKMILESELSENPYELSFLENKHADYLTQNPDAGFSIQELFEEKWLINTMDEWRFNCESKKIFKDISVSNGRLNHIIRFISGLAIVNFKDERKIIVRDFQTLLEMHQSYFKNTPDSIWFEEKGIVKKEKDTWLLDHQSRLIEPFMDYVFAKLWSQTTLEFNTDEQKIKWWMEYYELFKNGYGFGKLTDRQNLNLFIKASIRWIIDDGKLGDWDDEEKIAITKRLLDNPEYLEKSIAVKSFPKDIFDILSFLDAHYYTLYHYISEPRGRINHLLHIYFTNYDRIIYEGHKEDFCNILGKPFVMCMLIQHYYKRNGSLIADQLLDKRTVFSGCICLLKYFTRQEQAPQLSDAWNQTLKVLGHTISVMSKDKKSRLFFDLGLYLIKSGRFHLESSYIHFTQFKQLYLEAYRVFIWMLPQYIQGEADIIPLLDEIGNRLKQYDVPIRSKEFYFLIDLLESIKRDGAPALPIDLLNKGYDILRDSYVKSMNYTGEDYYVLSPFKSSLMESGIWGDIVAHIQGNNKNLFELIRPLSKDDYKISIESEHDRANLLKSKATVHLLFISSLLRNEFQVLHNPTKVALIGVFIEYFKLFQDDDPRLDIFDISGTGPINSERTLEAALECLSYIDKKSSDSVIAYLKKIDTNKLIFMLKYIRNFEIREELETTIFENIGNINTHNIYYLPQIQNLIENIILTQNHRLISTAVTLIDDYTATIQTRGVRIYKDNKDWIDSTRMRIARINKDYDTILSSDLKFYHGIVYLESDKHRDYQKAIQIYTELLKDDHGIQNKENLLCAYILGVTKIRDKGEDYYPMLEHAEQLIAEIRDTVERVEFDKNSSNILYYNILYLYSELEDSGEFWRYYNGMPEELKKSKKCGLYRASMLGKEGKAEQVKKVIKSLYEIYGNDPEIATFEKDIENTLTLTVFHFDNSLKETQYHFTRLKKLNLFNLCQVILDPPSSKEILLAKMVMDTCEKVNAYASNLIYNDKASDEDRYSLLFKELFNFRYASSFDFFIGDQSKSGFSGTITQQKRAGMGENDLVIHYENRIVSIIEALCLDSVVKKTIFEHVNKLFGYDISDCSIMFVIIYGTGKNPKRIWDGYCDYLKNGFIDDCSKIRYNVYEQCNAMDFIMFKNSHFMSDRRINWMYCTKHKNNDNGADVLLVHLFIDVLKAQQQEMARSARGKNNSLQ